MSVHWNTENSIYKRTSTVRVIKDWIKSPKKLYISIPGGTKNLTENGSKQYASVDPALSISVKPGGGPEVSSNFSYWFCEKLILLTDFLIIFVEL